MLGGFTKGIFVTTSDFQAGVHKYIERYQVRGYEIELMNAEKFYSALGINKQYGQRVLDEFDTSGFKKKMTTLVTNETSTADFEDYGAIWGDNFPELDGFQSIFE